LWTIERYTDEVEAVRRGLGLDQFYLLGHSWGGLLAIEYTLKYQQHLQGLVISNMAASSDSFVKHVSKIRGQFPADVRAMLEYSENTNKTMIPRIKRCYLTSSTRSLSVDWIHGPIRCSGAWTGEIRTSITYCKDEVNSKQPAT
jgi:proline-specific peptidase